MGQSKTIADAKIALVGGRRLRVGEAHMFGQQVAGLAQLDHSTAGSPNQTNFQHLPMSLNS